VPVDAASRSDWDTGGTGGDAARELLRAVTRLEHDHSSRAIAVVTELADRVQRDGSPVPFDAQTVFYRIRAASPPDWAAQLAPAAWRLGFADGNGEEKGEGGDH